VEARLPGTMVRSPHGRPRARPAAAPRQRDQRWGADLLVNAGGMADLVGLVSKAARTSMTSRADDARTGPGRDYYMRALFTVGVKNWHDRIGAAIGCQRDCPSGRSIIKKECHCAILNSDGACSRKGTAEGPDVGPDSSSSVVRHSPCVVCAKLASGRNAATMEIIRAFIDPPYAFEVGGQ
jgi:hypothetical protein